MKIVQKGLDFDSKKPYIVSADYISQADSRAHNPEVTGSNPVSATKNKDFLHTLWL